MSLDSRELRNAFGSFATGITVITCQGADGRPAGLTANSFTSVSLDPPMVLFCLAKKASVLEAFEGSETFVVNILGTSQETISNTFAMPAEDRFADLAYTEGLGQAPVIKGSIAVFECQKKQWIEAGDHIVVMGEVARFSTTEDAEAPLLYYKGQYCALED